LKIALVANEYPSGPHGGIGTFNQGLARALVSEGHQVTVIGTFPQAKEWNDQGVRVVCLARPTGPWAGFRERRNLYRRLRREVHEGRIELIETVDFHGPMPRPFPDAPVVVRLHLTQTIILRHAGRFPRPSTFLMEWLTLRTHRDWIGVSQHAIDMTRRAFWIRPRTSRVVYNFATPVETVDIPASLPERFVLYGGAVSQRKGAYVLAEAARKFLPADPSLHLVYAGSLPTEDGVSPDERIRGILGHELANRVHFPGALRHPVFIACMKRALAFTFPSTLEFMPLVVIEAMLAGTPPVVCDLPPMTELVAHEKTGLLVPPGDVSSLADAVLRLCRDAAFRQRLSEDARREIDARFTLAQTVRGTMEFYKGAIEAFHRKRNAGLPHGSGS
jgi:glycosyltransferase involved in cell wall biosynthesis